jgi:acyl transferase domain-containing protein
VTSGRIANQFNLNGMNCVVDSACASSLTALRVAMDEIQSGGVETMITGEG